MSSDDSQTEMVDPQVKAILRALAPEEIDMLRDAFIFMDKDSDGFVSKEEMMAKVEECVGDARFPPLLEYLTPLFTVADKDQDGRLSLTEFLMSFADGPGVVPAEVINNCVALVRIRLTDEEISTLQENFHAIDINEDGFIDAAELEAALRENLATKFPDLTDGNFKEIVTVVMASADADRDGKLSLSEFIRSFQEDQGVLPGTFLENRSGGTGGVRALTEDETQVLREAFAVLDKNNDGYVDFVDLYNALWETLSNSVEDQSQIRDLCDLIMVTADRKKNGRITVSEFIRGFLMNMDLMLIPVAVAQERVRAGCAKLQQMLESGDLDRLVMVFEELDSNGDGYLDRAEMVAVLTSVFEGAFPEWDQETLGTVMTAIVVGAETHDSGRLSLEEFIRSFVEGPGVIPPEVVSAWKSSNERSFDIDQADVSRTLETVHAAEGGHVDEEELLKAVNKVAEGDALKGDAIFNYILNKFTVAADDVGSGIQGWVWGPVPPTQQDTETPVESRCLSAEVTASSMPLHGASRDDHAAGDGSTAADEEVCESSASTVVEMVSVRCKNRHPSVQATSVELEGVSSLHMSTPSAHTTTTITGVEASPVHNDEEAISSSSAGVESRPYWERRGQEDTCASADEAPNASGIQASDHVNAATDHHGRTADEETAAPPEKEVATTTVLTRMNPDGPDTTSPYKCGDVSKTPQAGRAQMKQGHDSGFDTLFEEELHTLFRKYDTEDQGYLDREWFKQVYASMEQYGLEPTKEEINRRFHRYSRDREKVYFNEFCVLMLERVRM